MQISKRKIYYNSVHVLAQFLGSLLSGGIVIGNCNHAWNIVHGSEDFCDNWKMSKIIKVLFQRWFVQNNLRR
jgi:hypothetical protein